jgi:hypothetical protein
MKKYLTAFLMIGMAALLSGQAAWADGTCTQFLAGKAAQAKAKSQWWNIEISMHRENATFVTYSAGWLSPNSDGSFTGHSNQLFSDRNAGQQPFNINAADQLDLRLSPTALLRIHYHPWNFDTSWDMSCKGSMLTTYVPNYGIVTLTFRDLISPVH